jgi:tRNA pseudouridine38-40 synthase
MRYFLAVSYKGTNYHGWQIQKNAHSVQAEIEKAMTLLLKTPINIMASGRTDKGVHCLKQYAHFDFAPELAIDNLKVRLNSFLPADIAISGIYPVQGDTHARFDAIQRHYQYRLTREKNPFHKDLLAHYKKQATLDWDLMNQGAALLLKYQDYECFCRKKAAVNNYLCTITHAKWTRRDDGVWVFDIAANRFLWGMVRTIVGTLIDVGTTKLSLTDFEEIILSKERQNAGGAAPAEGLFLSDVIYPESIWLKN